MVLQVSDLTSMSGQNSHASKPSPHWFSSPHSSKIGPGRPLAHSSFVSLMEMETVHKVINDLTLHEGIGKWAARAPHRRRMGNLLCLDVVLSCFSVIFVY